MASPNTRLSLLERLADRSDADAWRTFHAIYEPLLQRLLSSWGVTEQDRREIVQEVLAAVAKAIPDYEKRAHAGAFRGWLSSIARHKMIDLSRGRARFPQTVGGSDFQLWLNEQPAPDMGSRWDIEHRRAIFAWAASQVRRQVKPRTWQAFEETVVRGQAVAGVAADMKVSVGWIYVARGRVLARLKELVQGIDHDSVGTSEIEHDGSGPMRDWEDKHAL